MGETIKSQRTFSIREPDKRNARSIRKTVLHYKHVENMLTLLIQEELNRITAHADRGWSLFNDLTNPQIMKGVLTSNQGGKATRDGIARVNHALGHHELLKNPESPI